MMKLSILIHKQGSNSFSRSKIDIANISALRFILCFKGNLNMIWFTMKLPSRDSISFLSLGFYIFIGIILLF